MSLSQQAAGPFEDVFTAETRQRRLYDGNALAALVHMLVAVALGRLASRSGKREG